MNLTGHRYGRWTVIEEVGRKHGGATWLARCDCGNEKVVKGNCLRTGSSKSCGCLNVEVHRRVCIERNTKHGLTNTKAFSAWVNIRQRCENKSTPAYKKYGAKGIKVCERWHSFESFLADMGEPPSLLHTIDRIDSSGDYEPKNCRWATQKEQQNNRSSNRVIRAFGKDQTLQQWSEELSIARKTITGRLRLGWPVEKALTEPPVIGRNQYGKHP